MKIPNSLSNLPYRGLPEALSAHSSFFVSSARDATATLYGCLRGLFQSDRAAMLRMGEVNEIDHQAMQHMLTSGAIDWNGFGEQIARETGALLGGMIPP